MREKIEKAKERLGKRDELRKKMRRKDLRRERARRAEEQRRKQASVATKTDPVKLHQWKIWSAKQALRDLLDRLQSCAKTRTVDTINGQFE